MIVRELLTLLGFKVDESNADKYDSILDKLKKGALATTAAITAAFAAVSAIVAKTASEGRAIATASKRLGVGAVPLQGLEFAAEKTGASVDQLRAGLRFLQKNAVKAAGGGKEASKAFQKLGVNVKDAHGEVRPTEELFAEAAEGLQKIDNSAVRTALALKIFGRGGTALIPLLEEGAHGIEEMRHEAQELGFVFSEEDVAATKKLSIAMHDLHLIGVGIVRRFGVKLVPLFEHIVESKIEWLKANRALIDRGIKVLVNWIERAYHAGEEFLHLLYEHRVALAALGGVLLGVYLPGLLAIAGAYALIAVQAAIAAAIAAAPFLAVLALAGLIAAVIEDVYHFVKGDMDTALQELYDEFTREAMRPDAHWLVKVLAKIIELTHDAIRAIDDLFGRFFKRASEAGFGVAAAEMIEDIYGNAADFYLGPTKPPRPGQSKQRQIGNMFDGQPKSIADDPIWDWLKSPAFGLDPFGVETPATSSVAPQINVGGSTLNLNINGGGSEPGFIDALVDKVKGVLEDDRREAARELEGRVIR